MRSLYSLISQRLTSYFGSSPRTPCLRLHAPNSPSYPPSPPISPSVPDPNADGTNSLSTPFQRTINILLLSSTDGRDTLVDLTRTLAEMSQSHKLQPGDITQDLIDAELSATTSVPPSSSLPPRSPTSSAISTPSRTATSTCEPDLLLIFGPYVKLDGYPPWQVRLTEIFCVGDSGGGNSGRSGPRVEYQGFLRALWKFAGTEMRFGS
jgi:dehydrodolichyl diphosphate syntase complex subunit NUS1